MIEYTVKAHYTGTKHWYLDGKRHRTDGPAIEYADGSKLWYLDGELHRTDGPAIEWANGGKEWWLGGKRHRTDGPAIEYADGTGLWYLKGKQVIEVGATCNGKTVEIDGVKYKLVRE